MLTLKEGFTIIELMVALVIGTTLITIGVPSFSNMYQAYRADSEIRKIQQSLMFAKNQAISYGARVTLCPISGAACNANWKDGFSIFIDNGTPANIDTTDGVTDRVIKQIAPFNDNDFITYTGNSIIFTPDGLISTNSTAGTFSYCPGSKSSNNSRGVEVSLSGRVQLSEAAINCN
ncbi:type II transport protein GspH [Shewanella sp. VB17]|uniref:GspH/FimT family pseudopilin n=1 Tax=Shewanella sp. VB17 TaxID=2739432 RepID=UPI0015675647|nr:GspH/FimT family pseudopilin [Shewanella sp. VB17]NRD72813.1 type II transport protein GspH [Shewanella sp. VB17]